jgi:hypothetical protein
MNNTGYNQESVLSEKENKSLFLETYRPNIYKTVRYFTRSGFFKPEDEEDMIQELSLFLLEKSAAIINGYQGRAKFSTYITTILINRCRVLAKNSRKIIYEELTSTQLLRTSESRIPMFLLVDEFNKLDTFFALCMKKKFKLILCLKLIYKLPVSEPDITNVFPGRYLDKTEIEKILMLGNHSNSKLKDYQIYAGLTDFLNAYEGKSNSPDAIRRWVDDKMEEMILFLNGQPKQSEFTRESLQILVEKYFIR